MKKKAIEISMNTVIVAILLLVVLFVILAIFSGTVQDIAKKFLGFTDEADKQGDGAFNKLFSCEEGVSACRQGDLYRCEANKWVLTQDCGEDGCEKDACK